MPALLRKLKRAQPADNGADLDHEPKQQAPTEPLDLFLLIPADGGLSFRLFAFTGPGPAAAHLKRMGLPLNAKPGHVAFRTLHSPANLNGAAESLEVVVLIRDLERPGTVELYSFVDMEAASSFVRQEGGERIELGTVLMYWAAPVDLTPEDLASAPPDEDGNTVPVSTVSIPLPPRPQPVATAAVTSTVPPASTVPPEAAEPHETTVPPATPPKPQKTRQRDKTEDTRVRVPVSSAGPVFQFEPAAPATSSAPAPAKQKQPRTGVLAEIQAWGGWDGLAPLMIKAALANMVTYDQFERDPFATGRAKLIIGLAAFAAMIGAMNSGLESAVLHLPAFALGWGAFVYTAYAMGTQAFPGERGKGVFRRLALCLALATTPALLLVLGAVPTYGPLFVLGAYIWVLLATTTAVSSVLALNRDLSLIVATVGCLALFTVSQVIPLVLF